MVALELSKIVVVTVNVVFMVFGLACLIVGVIFKVGWDDVRDAFEDNTKDVDFDLQAAGDAVGYSAIVFGSFIIIVSFMGCAGACCRVKCLLIVYAVIVGILVIAQVSLVAYAAKKGGEAEDDLKTSLTDTLKKYKEDSVDSRSRSWSAVFELGECCAVNNYTDFKAIPNWKDTTLRAQAGISGNSNIPITCCKDFDYKDKLTAALMTANKACLDTPTTKNAYTEGCYDKVEDWINHSKGVLIGVGIAILILEIVLIAMAIFLFCRDDD